MANTVHEDQFMTVTHDPETSALWLIWLPATASMTGDDFKREMLRFAELSGEHAARGLGVDVRDFKHQMGEDVGEWRDQNVVPLYNAAGARRFAFWFPSGAPLPPEEPARSDGPAYVTRYFDSGTAAQAWLADGGASA